ncbi:MAG: MBL fold metallo-hydrolase [bacterium]|nr:MBL fold metallo-hydrolase [bacterium]
MLKRSLKIFMVFLFLSFSLNSAAQEKNGVKITYIGNEGFLISYEGKKIMTDAPSTYLDNYADEGESVNSKVVSCTPPFDDIDLLFITHSHHDHYDVQSVGQFMENSTKTVLITTTQIVQEMKDGYKNFVNIESRVNGVTPDLNSSEDLLKKGVRIKIYRFMHGGDKSGSNPENIGFLFTLDDKKFLHAGDTISKHIVGLYKHYRIDRQKVDFAFFPWFDALDPIGKKVLSLYIKPQVMIPMHMSAPGDPNIEQITERLRNAYPGIKVFLRSFEDEIFR